ncbi:MAG: M28 family peptidase [Rhodothermales bacterium]
MRTLPLVALLTLATLSPSALGQELPPDQDSRLFEIIASSSATRIENDIRTLAGFGTRSTLSDTVSTSRGIGAARRWAFDEFNRISEACGGCLDVRYVRTLVASEGNRRIPSDTWIVSVIAIQRGSTFPNRYVIMSGDIDSRNSDAMDGTGDAPGANDNASGLAGTLEAARLLTQYTFPSTIVYAGLSGEEQGLFGGQHLAALAKDEGWEITAVLNNDMIGNIEGVDGVIDNTTFRVFSEAIPAGATDADLRRMRVFGGEVDGPSRQIARYVHRLTNKYFTNLTAMMVYRLDRFGRGGHHRPFNDAGFAGVRIMETHENYVRQHQNIRSENGIAYGDVIEGVNFDYAAKLTAVNAITLASLAWAPAAPDTVRLGGAVQASAKLEWSAVADRNLAGYRVYWRDTTAPQWQHSRFVGKETSFVFENLVVDNYLFGVASVGRDGNESVVAVSYWN